MGVWRNILLLSTGQKIKTRKQTLGKVSLPIICLFNSIKLPISGYLIVGLTNVSGSILLRKKYKF
jgi:hypothetical protein